MATTEPMQQDRTEQYCVEHGALTAINNYYRLAEFVSLSVSTLSAVNMLYFLYRHHTSSLFFHNNLRVLFFSLSICCLAYDVMNMGIKVHHLTLSYVYKTTCELFLPKVLYMTMCIPIYFVWIGAQFVLVSIVIERWIAVIFRRSYETGYKKVGPALVLAAVLITSSVIVLLYYGETFEGPQINARLIPSTRYLQGNVLIISLLVTNFSGLVLTVALRLVRPRWQIRMPLSSKFQSKENRIASNLIFWISTMQFASIFFTQIGSLYIRLYHSKDPLSPAYKESIDLFNYYTLALPVLSTLYLVKVKKRRIKDITNSVNMRASGDDGWTNYYLLIQKQWM
ncbi:hypothetical protein GCK32_006792 [Trichostrongylus colubriformis]|uniref:Uncharacterized protein n=1 Tax=Trichostrongylus colubriformis TaxID=6319 RepID=A0AAN8J1E3_TRICO